MSSHRPNAFNSLRMGGKFCYAVPNNNHAANMVCQRSSARKSKTVSQARPRTCNTRNARLSATALSVLSFRLNSLLPAKMQPSSGSYKTRGSRYAGVSSQRWPFTQTTHICLQNRELQIMRIVRHPNIVQLKAFYYSNGERVRNLYYPLDILRTANKATEG